MSYNQGYNKRTSYNDPKIGTNNVQNPNQVGKIKIKNRRTTFSTKHLLQDYANEQLVQAQSTKSKHVSYVQKQQPAFKILDLDSEKNSTKNIENNVLFANQLDEYNVTHRNPASAVNQILTNDTTQKTEDDITKPSYSFNAASQLDNILAMRYQSKTLTTPNIKPPTVKLSSAELGNIPQPSTNPLIPSRSEMDQSLIRLANEKIGKLDQQQKRKLSLRVVGDIAWEDSNLRDFDPNDFRIFVGDLGHEVTDEMLKNAFSAYPSLQKVRVIRRPGARKNRGYGFVSFKNPNDYLKAMKEMNGKYIGVRPIKCHKSTWKERSLDTVITKQDERKKHGYKV